MTHQPKIDRFTMPGQIPDADSPLLFKGGDRGVVLSFFTRRALFRETLLKRLKYPLTKGDLGGCHNII